MHIEIDATAMCLQKIWIRIVNII